VRVIAVKTIKTYYENNPKAKQALLAWNDEVENAAWNNPNELKMQFGNCSILNSKRIIFNIHGNTYRLIVDIEFTLKIVFIVWIGTHLEYDKIDVKNIQYDKANKK
jgi:mRNA interferase HigB